jgi:hypothetical protein
VTAGETGGTTCGAGNGAVTLGSGASGTSGGDSFAGGAAIGDGAADRTGATLGGRVRSAEAVVGDG